MKGAGAAVGHAFRDGIARTASAPAAFAGVLALTLLFSLPSDLTPSNAVFSQYLTFASWPPAFGAMPVSLWLLTDRASALGGFLNMAPALVWLILWSFLLGGLIDRYARNRPTRGRGFFGACGAHFGAMLRLGMAELCINAGCVVLLGARIAGNGYARAATLLLVLTAGAIVHYARVRLVVEDRRSAVGALLAGGRFLRRHAAASVAIYVTFAACLVLSYLILLRQPPPGLESEWLTAAAGESVIALQLFLALASLASATTLFQARLAHASYTAGPRLEWPESPAAEAIANLAPSTSP